MGAWRAGKIVLQVQSTPLPSVVSVEGHTEHGDVFETDVGILLAIKDAAGGLCGNTQGGEGSKETH